VVLLLAQPVATSSQASRAVTSFHRAPKRTLSTPAQGASRIGQTGGAGQASWHRVTGQSRRTGAQSSGSLQAAFLSDLLRPYNFSGLIITLPSRANVALAAVMGD